MSFAWYIPSISPKHQEILCYGYIRHSHSGIIPIDIMRLCATLYSPTYYTLDDIKHGKTICQYISPIFTIGQFKCYLQLWPYGSNDKNIGKIRLSLCFAGIPPKIDQISTKFVLAIKETDSWCTTHQKTFSRLVLHSSWRQNILSCTLENVNQLTLLFGIHKMVISEKHKFRNATTVIPKSIRIKQLTNLKTQRYSWSIDDAFTINIIQNAPNVYGIASPIFILFGLKWYLTFCPNGSRVSRKGQANVYLHLASVSSPDLIVWIKQRLTFHHNTDESILEHYASSDGFGMDEWVKTEELMDTKKLFFDVEVTLIDVFSKKNVITDSFINENNVHCNDVIMEKSKALCSFKWMLSSLQLLNLSQNESLYSDRFMMFNLKWQLSIDSECKIHLCLLDKKLNSVDVLSVRCFVSVRELNVKYTLKGIFHRNTSSVHWGKERITMEDFKKIDKCTIVFEMELVDAYYNGRDVTHKFE